MARNRLRQITEPLILSAQYQVTIDGLDGKCGRLPRTGTRHCEARLAYRGNLIEYRSGGVGSHQSRRG